VCAVSICTVFKVGSVAGKVCGAMLTFPGQFCLKAVLARTLTGSRYLGICTFKHMFWMFMIICCHLFQVPGPMQLM